jgi:hypothetical protein
MSIFNIRPYQRHVKHNYCIYNSLWGGPEFRKAGCKYPLPPCISVSRISISLFLEFANFFWPRDLAARGYGRSRVRDCVDDHLHAERLNDVDRRHRPRKFGLNGVEAGLNRVLLRPHRHNKHPVLWL